MGMPLLVRLIDSEIEAIDLMPAQLGHGFDHARRVREQVCPGRVGVNLQPALPDLNVEPVHGDAQYGRKLVRAQNVRRMLPSRPLLGVSLEAGVEADALDRVRQHLVGAVG